MDARMCSPYMVYITLCVFLFSTAHAGNAEKCSGHGVRLCDGAAVFTGSWKSEKTFCWGDNCVLLPNSLDSSFAVLLESAMDGWDLRKEDISMAASGVGGVDDVVYCEYEKSAAKKVTIVYLARGESNEPRVGVFVAQKVRGRLRLVESVIQPVICDSCTVVPRSLLRALSRPASEDRK